LLQNGKVALDGGLIHTEQLSEFRQGNFAAQLKCECAEKFVQELRLANVFPSQNVLIQIASGQFPKNFLRAVFPGCQNGGIHPVHQPCIQHAAGFAPGFDTRQFRERDGMRMKFVFSARQGLGGTVGEFEGRGPRCDDLPVREGVDRQLQGEPDVLDPLCFIDDHKPGVADQALRVADEFEPEARPPHLAARHPS